MLKNLSIKCGLLIKTKNKTKATLKSILKSFVLVLHFIKKFKHKSLILKVAKVY